MKYILCIWLFIFVACSAEPTPRTTTPQPQSTATLQPAPKTVAATLPVPASASLPASKPSVPFLDMSTFDTSCKKASDCVLVQPSHCSRCGCINTPIAKKELKRFQLASGAIVCPPMEPLPPSAGCGGCPGYEASCKKGKCVAEP
jgi:hypothetical protein